MYMIAGVSQYVAVASFMEAWIEITLAGIKRLWKAVASFMEAWIEIIHCQLAETNGFTGRLLHGGVD